MSQQKMITGVHHTALRPTRDNLACTIAFYTQVLGFEKVRDLSLQTKDGLVLGAMLDSGDGSLVEVFGNGDSDETRLGTVAHICYRAQDVPAVMAAAAQAGYPPTDPSGQPRESVYEDVVLSQDPPYVLRVGFIQGPCGEIIEFAQELAG